MKFNIWDFFESLSREVKFHENPTRIMDTFNETSFTFMTMSRWILLGMRNVLDTSCKEKKTYNLVSITFLRKSRPLWDNVEKYGGTRKVANVVKIWRIRVACWLRKVTRMNSHAYAYLSGHPHHPQTPLPPTYLLLFHGKNYSRTSLTIALYVYCVYCYSWGETADL